MLSLLLAVIAAAAPDTLWSNVTSGGVYASAGLTDVSGDGVVDVVCGVNFWDDQPTLWAMSGADGDTLWTTDQCKGIYQDEGLAAAPDADGDGFADVLLATPGGYDPPGRSLIMVSGADGGIVWQWSAYQSVPGGTGWGYCCALMEDHSGDGYPEVIGGFGTSGSSGTGLAACLDGQTGDTLWTAWAEDAVEDIMAVPDANGDGIEDVCLGIGGNSYTSYTLVLCDGSTGQTLWSADGGGDVMGLGLLDRQDTTPLIVTSTWDGQSRAFNLGGTEQWANTGLGGWLLDIAGGPDLNGDGVSEAALAGDDGGTICLNGADGQILWSYPTGSNTWSVAWADSVWIDGEAVPCVAGGAVNGRRVTLVDATTGELVWEQPFSERVYNVSVVPSLSASRPSPVVMAGLQDQEPQPHHAWALATSLETGLFGDPATPSETLRVTNPCRGVMTVRPPAAGSVISVYDLSGRRVASRTADGETEIDIAGWAAGCYLVRAKAPDGATAALSVTVLP